MNPIKFLYNQLVEEKYAKPPETINKWIKELNSDPGVDEIIKEHVKQQRLIANNRLKSYNYNFLLRKKDYTR